jgi:hypothetical protein
VDAIVDLAAAPSRAVLAVVGLVLLLAGRRVVWLAVGALGFVAGYQAMERWGSGLPPVVGFVVAVAVGVVGILLAVLVQRVAVALAGFFLGVALGTLLLPILGPSLGPWSGLVIAAAGLVMAVVALALFSLALVVLTAGAGAVLLTQAIAPPEVWALPLVVVLWVVGVMVQRRQPD